MTYLKTFFSLTFSLVLANLSAQITAPSFECVRGDTLFWTPAINNCGPFVSTDIYYSTSASGPFNLLVNLSDATIDRFHHPVMGDAYYFLQANHDCAGLPASPSDTLNNLPPAITTLEKVTVQDNGVLVSWYDNMDNKTVAYIVYRSTSQGTLPIDTVFGMLEYLDQTASPDTRPESYYVLAMDQCGNTGIFDKPHQTVFLQTEIDFCRQYIKLNWNYYETWQNGQEFAQIWLGLDGGPLAFEHQVSDTLAFLTGIDDGRQYCIAIISKENGRNVTSASNTVCAVTNVITPVDQLTIRNVSVTASGDIEILWNHTSNADIKELLINFGLDASTPELLVDLSPNRPTSDVISTIDANVNVSQEVRYYQIKTNDECDEETSSNTMSSILLNVTTPIIGQNMIRWTELSAPGRQIIEYQLSRLQGTTETIVYRTPPGTLTEYLDMLNATDGAAMCYQLKAIHTNDSGMDTLMAFSNTVCIEPQTGVYVPNAFVPGGVNSIFKPEASIPGSITNYRMQVFNRWGGKVFETDNLAFGWNGSQDGNPLDPGVYFYLISFAQPDGKSEQLSGTVTLIR